MLVQATADRQKAGVGSGLYILWALACLYYIAKPVYLFDSGKPQIADALIFPIFLGTLMFSPLFHRAYAPVISWAFLFFVYAAFVNYFWFSANQDDKAIYTVMYMAFNFMVFFSFIKVISLHDSSLLVIAYVCISSAILFSCIALVAETSVVSYRETLFFNNPNQLGYWALLTCGIIALCELRVNISRNAALAGYAACFYLSALSLSKAAMIAVAITFAIHSGKKIYIAGCVAASSIFLLLRDETPLLFYRAAERLAGIGQQSDDSILARGYGRILEYPERLLFGAGEMSGQELHSSLGTIVYSYGIIGTVLFVLMLWRVMGSRISYASAYLIPPLLYGLTHQGIRFSIFWVFLAVLTSVARQPLEPWRRARS